MTETFADVFRRARRSARDPKRGGLLTQERFAELLAQEPGVMGTTTATISNWECGRSQPRRYDRPTLRALITVLLHCKGLATFDEANQLLTAGGYAPLRAEELSDGVPLSSQPEMILTTGNAIVPLGDPCDGKASTLIAIRHQSMEQIPANAITAWLPADLRNCEYIEICIDQCDLFENGRLFDPREAARRQSDLEKRVASLLVQHPDAQLAYYGIAHIPLLFLAGYTLSNRRAILLFQEDRSTRSWNLLQSLGAAPQLHLSGLPAEIERHAGDVVVRISISYRVTEDAVAELIPEPLASIELGLAQPHLDAVTSDAQLRAYTRAFREMMDQIHHYLPHATSIHIFYAGPPVLAFTCGQHVSKTIHPRLMVYNYFGRDRPRYSWGFDFMSPIKSDGFFYRAPLSEVLM